MKNIKLILIMAFILISSSLIAQKNIAYFLSDPTLSPDGKNIVFVYENDLWQVAITGGTPARLTGMEGEESNPRFSPDGKWLVFSSSQNGNADVYVMPVDGGEIIRLTFYDSNDFVEGWSWDSQSINFSSSRYNMVTSFNVKISGGTPTRLLGDNYQNNPHHIVEMPNETAYLFTESLESYAFYQRKRYKGDHNPNIKYYNTTTKEYKELTDYIGKDLWPTVDKDGNIYYASDETNTVYNLYSVNNGVKKQLTDFKTAIGRPQVSANGEKVVFTKDYQVFVYDVKSKSTTKPEINIFKNETLTTEISYKIQGNISNFDVSPDNKKIAFISRGRLFVSDIEGKFIKEMNTNSQERVLEASWFSDNTTLLYTRTNKGWCNLFSISATLGKDEKQLTTKNRTEQLLDVNPKRDKVVYVSGNNNLNILDLKTFKTEVIVEDEFWFRGNQPRFSPDGNFIVYTAYRNFESDVFVYDLKLKRTTNITNTGVPENDPFWSPDGKYLYISAERHFPSFPRGKGELRLYRIPLYRFTEDFKSNEYDNLFSDKKKKDTIIDIKFELENIAERWESIAMNKGDQYSPYVITEKGKTIVLFNLNLDKANSGMYKTEIESFERNKTEKISDQDFNLISKSKGKYYALSNGNIYKINISGNKLEKIDINHSFSKNLHDEFVQMFYENWAALAENFYDINYHGIDWKEVKTQYEAFVPYIRNRENLKTLQVDMLGELNASHLNFTSSGDEQETFYKQKSFATGILFENENPYIVKRFIQMSPVDILDNPIHPGDELIAVNAINVDKSKNRNSYFSETEIPDEVQLTFKRNNATYNVKIHPVSSRAINNLLYDEWIADRQKMVDDMTQKRVAYVHMKDMGWGSLNDFLIDMTTEAVHRDALILDLRYNRGGNVHDDVLQFLSQKPYMEWKYRNGKMSPQPNFAPSGKPIILLVNEHSLSDAEVTAAGFHQLKLGKIIGTETYRWIIFTSGRSLVDGSYTRLPVWGCYDLAGNDLELTGVAPDIYVKNKFKDRLNNSDPQLERAILEILKELK